MKSNTMLVAAGVVGGLGVIIGAFGAHSLPKILADLPADAAAQRIDWLETGVKYHMYHAAALLAVGLSPHANRVRLALVCWLVGIAIFSGCLYAMSLTGIRVLGAIVPIGGLAMIVGWAQVALAGLRGAPTADQSE